MLSIDFVVELPESSRHDAVMTVIDSVSKRVHFVPMHTMVTAEGAARLFLHYVWKLHGLPKRLVSNHRSQFMALFTKKLYRLLGIQLSSSTAWSTLWCSNLCSCWTRDESLVWASSHNRTPQAWKWLMNSLEGWSPPPRKPSPQSVRRRKIWHSIIIEKGLWP